MTRKELSVMFEVDIKTLSNWEKNKPELIRIINLGLQVENQINKMEEDLKKLKELKENSNKGKLIL